LVAASFSLAIRLRPFFFSLLASWRHYRAKRFEHQCREAQLIVNRG
jgi:hypothetical protein